MAPKLLHASANGSFRQSFNQRDLDDDFECFDEPTEAFQWIDPDNDLVVPVSNIPHGHVEKHFSPQPNPSGRPLRSVAEIPINWQSIFPFGHFNAMQSACLDKVLYSQDNIVVSAPTGAGKTVVLELAMIEVISRGSCKIVYLAPSKSLCSERYEDWKTKLSRVGLHCALLTSDTESDLDSSRNATVLVSTPEKWDSLTRRWTESRQVIEQIKLFIIDEVHVLNETRGSTLEAVVSRMKTIHLSDLVRSTSKMRFIAVSATIPNINDIARWLGDGPQPATILSFDESYRPVRLQRVVLGYPASGKQANAFMFDHSLNYKLVKIIEEYGDNRPVLIFCNTRKSTVQAAQHLVSEVQQARCRSFITSADQRNRALISANQIKEKALQDCVKAGVGFHHAGLHFDDRRIVEDLFIKRFITVVCTTSTLAIGVNLPAHMVIVKSTQQYNNGSYVEYSDLDVLQMIGRAGRPQFDDSGIAVIMTTEDKRRKYETLIDGTETIESSFQNNLVEHINAEVALGSICNVSMAITYLKCSFMYIRMLSDPGQYGLGTTTTDRDIEKKLEEMCLQSLKQLSALNLLTFDDDGFCLQTTEYGQAMARYYVKFETMKIILNSEPPSSLEATLQILAKAAEFDEFRFQQGNKQILNALNKEKTDRLRFPIKGTVKEIHQKISILIQASLSHYKIESFPLQQEAQRVMHSGIRVTRCMMECFKGNYAAQLNSILMHKALKSHAWENSQYVLLQIEKIGMAKAVSLAKASITTFRDLAEADPRRIEMICGRNAPFGDQAKAAAAAVPRYCMKVKELESGLPSILVIIDVENCETAKDEVDNFPHMLVLLIGDHQNRVVYRNIYSARAVKSSLRVRVPLGTCTGNLHISFISLAYVGIDVSTTHTIGTRFNVNTTAAKTQVPLLNEKTPGSIKLVEPPANLVPTFELDTDSDDDLPPVLWSNLASDPNVSNSNASNLPIKRLNNEVSTSISSAKKFKSDNHATTTTTFSNEKEMTFASSNRTPAFMKSLPANVRPLPVPVVASISQVMRNKENTVPAQSLTHRTAQVGNAQRNISTLTNPSQMPVVRSRQPRSAAAQVASQLSEAKVLPMSFGPPQRPLPTVAAHLHPPSLSSTSPSTSSQVPALDVQRLLRDHSSVAGAVFNDLLLY